MIRSKCPQIREREGENIMREIVAASYFGPFPLKIITQFNLYMRFISK